MPGWGPRRVADVGIDLGTTSTRVLVPGGGLVAELPTAVAIQDGAQGRRAIAFGLDALRMLGRTAPGTRVILPVRGGMIEDFEAAEHLLRSALGRATEKRPRVLIGVPLDASETERRALQECARAAGAREVHLVHSALAAAIGAQVPVRGPTGSMIVLVGGGRTEVGVVSLGGFVVRRSLKVAGEAMDAHVVQWLRRQHHVMIGLPTAERIKLDVGAARPPERVVQTRVRGRDLSTGAPRVIDLQGSDVAEAVREPVERIRDAVLDALREAPPEICADVLASGIVLLGAAARLPGLDDVLRDAVGLPVLHGDQPQHAVARGLGRILDDIGLQEDLVVSA